MALRGELVFDAANPEVFAKYAGAMVAEPGVAGMPAELPRSRTPLRRLRGERATSAGRVQQWGATERVGARGTTRAVSPFGMVGLGRRNLDVLAQRAASPVATGALHRQLRATSAPMQRAQSPGVIATLRAQSPGAGASDAVAAAMCHVSMPSLSCRRCDGLVFTTVDLLRAHIKTSDHKG